MGEGLLKGLWAQTALVLEAFDGSVVFIFPI